MRTRIPPTGIGLGMAVLIAILALVIRAQGSSAQTSPSPTPTPHPGAATGPRVPLGPTPRPLHTTDLAASLPSREKAVVYAQRADGSEEAFLVPPRQVGAFIRSLPAGDRLIAASPPEDVIDRYPTPGSQVPGTVRYPGIGPTPTPQPTP